MDSSRTDPYGRGGQQREVHAVVWYPAALDDAAPPAPYLPRSWGLHAALWGVAADRVGGHSFADAPLPPGNEAFPVLLFSPAGWAPYFYAAMLEELASHGYIVVGLAHTHEMIPMTAFTDGHRRWFRPAAVAGALTVSKRPHDVDVRARGAVVDRKADDLCFALEQFVGAAGPPAPFTGRVRTDRVGVFGHSFGGGAAVVASQRDSRFAACGNLDGALWREPERASLQRPCVLLFAEHPEFTQPCAASVDQKMFSSVEWCEQDRALHLACWAQLVSSATPGTCCLIRGSEHRTFMDWRLLPLHRWSIGRMGHATIAGVDMWKATTGALLTLFDEHVRGVAAPSFEDLAAVMGHLQLGTPEGFLASES